ncbi:MAG: HAMP domain-containing histidine kinase, partial [Alkalinema sp. RU_4_3]|nr:HAMP domain-containing histidine kinase [Alkalinema sp. RU_4_3]
MEPGDLNYWRAVELAQFKAGFLARTSHELRSPLNGMISGLQLILSDLCDDADEEREYVKIAHDSALKLVELMDQVIMVSRVEIGGQSLKMAAVDLDILLQEVFFLTRMQAENRNIRLVVPMLEEEIEVIADMNVLRQGLMGLIDGTVGLMDEGRIEVVVEGVGDRAYVGIVADPVPGLWCEPLVLGSEASGGGLMLSPGFRISMCKSLLEGMGG